MLVATTLSAVLLAAILLVLASLSRAQRQLDFSRSIPRPQALLDRLRWDVINASTITQAPDGQTIVLVGHGGIDPASLMPTGRLTRVVYRCLRQGRVSYLVREQENLDDPAQPQRWRDLMGIGFTRVAAIVPAADAPALGSDEAAEAQVSTAGLARGERNAGKTLRVPPRVRVHLEMGRTAFDEEVWVK